MLRMLDPMGLRVVTGLGADAHDASHAARVSG
jgi:hypothetical protein